MQTNIQYTIRNTSIQTLAYLGNHGWTTRPFARRFSGKHEAFELVREMLNHDPSKVGKLVVERFYKESDCTIPLCDRR